MKQSYDGEISIPVKLVVDIDDNKLVDIDDSVFSDAIKNVLLQHGFTEDDILLCDTQFVEGEYGYL